MTRDLELSRQWQRSGTDTLLHVVRELTDADLDAPSALPGWSRRHVVAHLAANADALLNLVQWAATGVETPMYASPEARAQGIEAGVARPTKELLAWTRDSAETLERRMACLSDAHWDTAVRTAQGRVVPATEIPWLRDREVFVHLVDLDRGVTFADLPGGFLAALREDIEAKRGAIPTVTGSPADVTAWLAGRPHGPVRGEGGATVAPLGPWL